MDINAQCDSGGPELAAPTINALDVQGEDECLFLRTLGTGTYRKSGLELGLITAHGNAFASERGKASRAERWIAGFLGQFTAVQMSGSASSCCALSNKGPRMA